LQLPATAPIVYRQACQLGCEGIASNRLGSTYRFGRSKHWIKVKNPAGPPSLLGLPPHNQRRTDAANAAPHDVSGMLATAERKRTSRGFHVGP
jgi:hypothetical protein